MSTDHDEGFNTNYTLTEERRLRTDKWFAVRKLLASNRKLSASTMDVLANDENWSVRRALAFNRTIGTNTTSTLASDEVEEVRAALASNPKLPLTVMAVLVGDPSQLVRSALASNPGLTEALQRELAKDERLTKHLIKNSHLAHSIQEELFAEDAVDYGYRLASVLNLSETLQDAIAAQPYSISHRSLARNPNLTSFRAIVKLKQDGLADHFSAKVRKRLKDEYDRIRLSEGVGDVPDEWIDRAFFS